MPFPFALICDLLETCHQLAVSKKGNRNAVIAWFTRHQNRIGAHDTSIAALLSTLLPEKRTDRVYCIQAASLEKIIGRSLMLGSSRIAELALYKRPGHGTDLGDCVERILKSTPNPTGTDSVPIAVEDVDAVLHRIASKVKWSSPSVRASQSTISTRNRLELEDIFRQLSPTEAKWLARLVLKDYRPVVLEPQLLYGLCDPLLPNILKIQDDFASAIGLVGAVRATLLPNALRKASGREQILTKIKPKLGIKVGRQHWVKGRSIKHCLDVGHGCMSVEQKLDGEYCQIHVDISKGRRKIQIFSKSGKDSTEDRRGIARAVLDSLKLGQTDCKIRKGCILEGELLVYDHKEGKIMPFHKIRKYVTRRGQFLNTEQDSPPKPHEKLMIVYYDLLLLDDESLLNVRHSDRFKLLQGLIRCVPGVAELVQRKIIDFSRHNAASDLRNFFAKTIQNRSEGLVLKPNDPYFDFMERQQAFSSCCIKLKKEYIGHFGDVGDFAVVGAGFDPAKAKSYRISNLKWTHFFIACLNNKEEVKRWNAIPNFTVVNVVEINESLLNTLIDFSSPVPVPIERNTATHLHIAPGVPNGTPMSVAFTNPLVFDLRCFSFDKPGNTGFWNLRFPVVTKIHFDRDYTDTISFAELQQLAADATTAPELEDSQENLRWIAALEAADPRGIAVDAASQLTATTIPTPSPQRSSQSRSEISCTSTVDTSKVLHRAMNRPGGVLVSVIPTLIPSAPEQLVTPPTSSPAGEPLHGKKESQHHSTRPPVLSSPLPSAKCAKLSAYPQALPAAANVVCKSSSQRRPLEDIDGNSSQRSASLSMSSLPDEENKPGEKARSPILPREISFAASVDIVRVVSSSSSSQSLHRSKDPTETELSELPVSGIRPQPLAGTRNESWGNEAELYRVRVHETCRQDGSGCPLANSVVVVPCTILENYNEMLLLLRGHGIDVVIGKERPSQQEDQVGPLSEDGTVRTIMFVDSINNKSEVRQMLRSMERNRTRIYGYERDWIDVYDWRLLQDITVSETHTKEGGKKRKRSSGYAGFLDPWRRWHCGFV